MMAMISLLNSTAAVTTAATSEYMGRWGVFDLMAEYGLTRDEALRVSDHLPVWAEFSVYEATGPVASRPAVQTR